MAESRKPSIADVDAMFLKRAQDALQVVGQSALEFLAANPGLASVELAQRLNHGANAIGLQMAIFREAIASGGIRAVAWDLLVRAIRHEFHTGWDSSGEIGPSIRLGSWAHNLGRFSGDPSLGTYSWAILRHLAITDPPPEGWLPDTEHDPLLTEIFDRYWPQ